MNGLRAFLADMQICEVVGVSSIHASKAKRASINSSRQTQRKSVAKIHGVGWYGKPSFYFASNVCYMLALSLLTKVFFTFNDLFLMGFFFGVIGSFTFQSQE